jgi:mannose-6-phosphate isomerase-like protein (cupin superfamily)
VNGPLIPTGAFQAAHLDEVVTWAREAPDGYAPRVLRSELLSVGLYTLPADGTDDQSPHAEDEVYYVVRGRATLRVGAADHTVRPGSLLFVPARTVHFFHHIDEELVLVVFWAPPEGTGDASGAASRSQSAR